MFIVALIAHLPIFLQCLGRMWSSGHYQFVPLLLAVLVYLVIERRSYIFAEGQPTSQSLTVISLLINFAFLAVATLMGSTFLGSISLWILAFNFLFCHGGVSALRRGSPWLAVAIFAIPMPAPFDDRLVLQLQFVASNLASRILDNLGIIHFVEGVVLVTHEKQFMTEEACSGVRSLFSSLAGITLFSAVLQLPWWRYIANLIQVLLWVIIGNAMRVAIVVYASEHWSESLAVGLGHDLLGLLMFLVIMALSISTDRLMQAFCTIEEDDYYSPQAVQTEASANGSESERQPALGIAASPSNRWIFIILFSCIFVLGATMQLARAAGNNGFLSVQVPRLKFPVESDLPKTLKGWRLINYQFLNRGKQNLQAEDSFVWTYVSDRGLQATFSLDCPWATWHNLSFCYRGLGWNVVLNHHNDTGALSNWSTIEMEKFTGERGIVFFRNIDRFAEPIKPQFSSDNWQIGSALNRTRENLAAVFRFDAEKISRANGIPLPASTLQLVCTPDVELTDEMKVELQELFLQLSNAIVDSPRYTKEGERS